MNTKKYKLHFFIFTISLFFFHLTLSKDTLAVRFFNGQHTVLMDINNPNEDLFGGSNSNTGIPRVDSTNLTITTQDFPHNTLRFIFGGGMSGRGLVSNTITGDVILTVNNTNATKIAGGSVSLGGYTTIGGSIFLTVTDSNITEEIYGASMHPAGVGSAATVVGDVNINLSRVTANALYGAGNCIGLGAKNIAVGGNININLDSCNIAGGIFLTSDTAFTNVVGDVTLNTSNSTIGFIIGTEDSDIYGNLTINIGAGTKTAGIFGTNDGNIHGLTTININGSEVIDIVLGPNGRGTIGTVVTNISNSEITNLICGAGGRQGEMPEGIVNLYSGYIENLMLGSNYGLTNVAVGNIYDGTVNLLTIGTRENAYRLLQGATEKVILNIYGGTIYTIDTAITDASAINFLPGKTSIVRNSINGNGTVDTITIQRDARTQWGSQGKTFPVKTNNFIMSGELVTAPGSTIELFINNAFIADGGIVLPMGLMPGATEPPLWFIGGPQSTLTIDEPLTVNLIFSPKLIGANHIPLTTVTDEFAHPGLFIKQNRKGLIWSDTEFDPTDNTWYLSNIKPSEDFYGLSAAREATNWLRQQHTWSIQRRSSKLLDHELDGLWINLQGGHEKLDAAIGEAKMPWAMVSIGYDYLQKLPSIASKALYGFGFGFTKGQNKWSTVNTTKNNITMGMLAGYLGLMHNSGIYSTATLQIANSRITTKCSGFATNYKWKETIPTEAFELGWQYTFKNGIKINPRGQVILEQLSKTHFKLPEENDRATLDKTMLTTTVVGLSGEYAFHISAPTNLQISVDWIKGIAGDFAAKSRLLNMKFKDKNDTSVIRTSLGLHSQVREELNFHIDTFVDAGHDKGLGGQIGATYKF